MPSQPADYEDEHYGYPDPVMAPVLKYIAWVVGAVISGSMVFTVSCTFNKMDTLLDKQETLSGDIRDLRGDVKVVTAKLEAQEKQYERDRDEANRRFNAIERGP